MDPGFLAHALALTLLFVALFTWNSEANVIQLKARPNIRSPSHIKAANPVAKNPAILTVVRARSDQKPAVRTANRVGSKLPSNAVPIRARAHLVTAPGVTKATAAATTARPTAQTASAPVTSTGSAHTSTKQHTTTCPPNQHASWSCTTSCGIWNLCRLAGIVLHNNCVPAPAPCECTKFAKCWF